MSVIQFLSAIIADNSLKEDDFDVFAIEGLGATSQLGSKGYVVFSKTRVPNKAFYQWFNQTIMIPFIRDIRSKYDISDDVAAYVTFDGEALQLSPYYNDNIIKDYDECNVYLMISTLFAQCLREKYPNRI